MPPLMEILIPTNNDRSLPQRGTWTCAREIALVDAHPYFVRVREQVDVEQAGVLGIQLAHLGF